MEGITSKRRKTLRGEKHILNAVSPEREALRIRTQVNNRFNGFKPGRIVCIDNLGWAFCESSLTSALLNHLKNVKDVRFAITTLPNSNEKYYGGWGCVEFNTYEAAIEGLGVLDTLYIDLPDCPVPRPIIAHFPLWTDSPSENAEERTEFGSLDLQQSPCNSEKAKPFAAHFAQLNNMGSLGLVWVEKDEICHDVKQKYIEQYKYKLAQILEQSHGGSLQEHQIWALSSKNCAATHRNRAVECANGNFVSGPECRDSTCTFWLQGVVNSVQTKEIQQWFEQFDIVKEIVRATDPVSLKPNGHIALTVDRPDQALKLKQQLDTSLLLIGGVRPLRCQLATGQGRPTGFESILDEALAEACGFDTSSCAPEGRLVTTLDSFTEEERILALECRKVLEECSFVRGALFKKAAEVRYNLHKQQEKAILQECQKLDYLNKHIPHDKAACTRNSHKSTEKDQRSQKGHKTRERRQRTRKYRRLY